MTYSDTYFSRGDVKTDKQCINTLLAHPWLISDDTEGRYIKEKGTADQKERYARIQLERLLK